MNLISLASCAVKVMSFVSRLEVLKIVENDDFQSRYVVSVKA